MHRLKIHQARIKCQVESSIAQREGISLTETQGMQGRENSPQRPVSPSRGSKFTWLTQNIWQKHNMACGHRQKDTTQFRRGH